jgi:hypothetical protein
MRNLLFAILMAGWAAPAGAGLLSAKGDIIAIMGGALFLGEAEGHLNGSGTLAIHSQKTPTLTCLGEFTSSAESGGKGQLRCSDGSKATFSFTRLSLQSGHGGGPFTRGTMNFTYGLTLEEARAHLKLPKGKKLRQDGTKIELVEREAQGAASLAMGTLK